MNYVGKWLFHSMGTMNENDELVYLSKEEYLNSPIGEWIDESDEEAVADEMRERKQIAGGVVEICDDGKLYMLMPIPEGIPESDIEEAVKNGEINLRNGMFSDTAYDWEERDGELWFDTRIEGEVFGEKADGWAKAIDEDGFFKFMMMRYAKE